jgi:hypothetical protein
VCVVCVLCVVLIAADASLSLLYVQTV